MKLVALSGLATLMACDEAGSDSAAGGTVFVPRAGTWEYVEGDLVAESCNLFGDVPMDDDLFELESRHGELFIYDGTFEAACELERRSFFCTSEQVSRETIPDLGITLSTWTSISGTLVDRDHIEGHHEGEISCEGANCAEIERATGSTLPCTYELAFKATARH